MKSNFSLKIYLVTLFLNMVITFFIGYKYKDYLVSTLSPTIYYQGIVFISLSLPLLVTWLHDCFLRYRFLKRLEKLKQKAPAIDQNTLDEESRDKLEKLTKQDLPTTHEIKELHEQMERMFS
ncbi:hypothetical protein [Klebsiella spallanzanii]|uniref:hypothetical protein n=1 Tax=Klebsiella spallanzanii TaxID=2587528 RepID=UPI001118E4D2|nr:hypothetical protein [Klebsiella spallanzanii]